MIPLNLSQTGIVPTDPSLSTFLTKRHDLVEKFKNYCNSNLKQWTLQNSIVEVCFKNLVAMKKTGILSTETDRDMLR